MQKRLRFGFLIKQFVKFLLQAAVLPVVYRYSRRRRMDERLVVFADAHSRTVPRSMESVREAFIARGYRVADCFFDTGRDSFAATLKNMFAFMRLYAAARYVIICNYFLPSASCEKRGGTKLIQLWHGCGILKRFGYDTAGDIPKYYLGNPVKNIDMVSVSAPVCVNAYASAFLLPRKAVMPLGVGRTDKFFSAAYNDACKVAFNQKFPAAKDKKIAVFAPTFRGDASHPSPTALLPSLDAVRAQLGDAWELVVCLHPHCAERDADCGIAAERMFAVADVLITDYSSIIFEYALYEKPLVLFVPDLAEYTADRGFYLDLKALPAAIVTDATQLAAAIVHEDESFDRNAMRRFKEQYMSACDGNATERIVNEIENLTSERI
ncbi:MAG: CDP-glycerol glycerophosphotransferase family protein [Oscillospiraceae bacterium]